MDGDELQYPVRLAKRHDHVEDLILLDAPTSIGSRDGASLRGRLAYWHLPVAIREITAPFEPPPADYLFMGTLIAGPREAPYAAARRRRDGNFAQQVISVMHALPLVANIELFYTTRC